MKTEDVTAQIMSAWEEIETEESAEPEASAVEEETPEPDETPETPETEIEEADDDGEADEAEEDPDAEDEADEKDDGESEEADDKAEVAHEFDDVEVQAFLSKYGGDVSKALKGAAELSRLMGRHGQEKTELGRKIEALESQLAQAQAFGGVAGYLTDEQQAWVEAAAESPNPGGYVGQALQAGQFELARAVCREWANSSPFEAMRAGQIVDATEYQLREQQAEPEAVPPETTWQALAQNYPELRTYEEQMVSTLERLGPDHPLVQEARSTDQAQAVRGIFGIYEIAKAATFALTETKNGLKQQRRKEADDAIDAAVVTSAANSPSAGETPRPRRLMPGLSEDEFERAFAPQ